MDADAAHRGLHIHLFQGQPGFQRFAPRVRADRDTVPVFGRNTDVSDRQVTAAHGGHGGCWIRALNAAVEGAVRLRRLDRNGSAAVRLEEAALHVKQTSHQVHGDVAVNLQDLVNFNVLPQEDRALLHLCGQIIRQMIRVQGGRVVQSLGKTGRRRDNGPFRNGVRRPRRRGEGGQAQGQGDEDME